MDLGGRACGGRVWYRVDGDKKPHHEHGGTLDEVDVVIMNLLSERQRTDLFSVQSSDFSYFLETPSGQRRFRTTCYFDQGHLGVCLRAIPDRVRSVESLGFSPVIARGMMFRHVRDGLSLVTGVTGSGKSTTLDAFIDANNHDFDGHIVIVAKPIEYVHTPDRCIIRHREVGPDVPSFKDGVTQALRQDPDIIMIGEMRDPETIDAAIEASDTGHKVFSTLHTSSTVESLDRMVAEYPHEEQNRVRVRLADVLRCVISQKLPPKIGGGRVLAKEVLWITPSVKAAILNNNTGEIYQMIWEGAAQGMVTMEQDLIRLYRERKITVETAMQYSNNKRRVQQLLTGGNAAAA
jgi:twitching motility protein PilT